MNDGIVDGIMQNVLLLKVLGGALPETRQAIARHDEAMRESLARVEAELDAERSRSDALVKLHNNGTWEAAQAQLAEAVALLQGFAIHTFPSRELIDKRDTFLARHAQGAQSVDAQKEISELIGFEFKPDELQTVNGDELLRVFWRGAALATQPAAGEPVAWMTRPRKGSYEGREFLCQPDDSLNLDQWEKPFPVFTALPAAGEPVGKVVSFGPKLHEVAWHKGKLPPLGTELYAAPPASAHGDEAVRKDATEAVMQRACAELPEDWYIEIHLENGSGYATLFNDGIVVDFGQDFESMGAQVEAALDAAMRAQGDGE